MSDLRLPSPPDTGPGARIWVAYSGGCDSTALLHLLAAAKTPGLCAVHVHHGLQVCADAWVRHCRALCGQWQVPLRVLRVRVIAAGEGPEAAARAARYAALARLLAPGDVLVTAHHRDDQAETVLFRALRGTGIPGLGAMRPSEPFAAGLLWRPLLDVGRSQLRAYAQKRNLSWIEDPHNEDPRLARVFLRRQILPQLRTHFPAVNQSLARLARHAQATEPLLEALAFMDAESATAGDALLVPQLNALDDARRRNLLYHVWRRLGLPPPDETWYARLEREVLDARADAEPVLSCGGGEARRYRQGLYLMRSLPPPPGDAELEWTRGRRLLLPAGCGELRLRRRLPAVAVAVRFARGGERLRPQGSRHRRTLKQLCQAAGVPPWLRTRMPLVYLDGELAAIAGWWRSDRAVALGFLPEWRHELPGAPEPAH